MIMKLSGCILLLMINSWNIITISGVNKLPKSIRKELDSELVYGVFQKNLTQIKHSLFFQKQVVFLFAIAINNSKVTDVLPGIIFAA